MEHRAVYNRPNGPWVRSFFELASVSGDSSGSWWRAEAAAAENLPVLTVLRGIGMGVAEPGDTAGEVGQLPGQPVQVEHRGYDNAAADLPVGVRHRPIAGVEEPEVPFRRGDQHGVPVDEHPL